MRANSLIDARLQGASVSRITEAVLAGRDSVRTLPEDKINFFEAMLPQVESALLQLQTAVSNDDVNVIRSTAESLQEIMQMIGDAADARE